MSPRLILSAVRISQDIEKIKGDFKEQMPGGKGEGKCIDDFDFFALLKGVLVELEHTDDPMLALEITMDHLTESPEYYDYLNDMEEQMKADGAIEDDDDEEENGDDEKGEDEEPESLENNKNIEVYDIP
jgi:ADP-ribosylglycohydrolase